MKFTRRSTPLNFQEYLYVTRLKVEIICEVLYFKWRRSLIDPRMYSQGYVAFSSQGDRIALTQIEQMIDGKYVKLGYYDTQSDNLTWRNMERWIGGKVPQDRTIVKTVLRTVSLPLFICMGTISSLGIIIAVALIIFNIWNRHRRYIIQKISFIYI